MLYLVDRDSSVGITTRYGIEFRCRRDFCTRPDSPIGPPSLPYNVYGVSFPGVKRPRGDIAQPPRSSAEVKEIVELLLYEDLWSITQQGTIENQIKRRTWNWIGHTLRKETGALEKLR
jgi:hypothetical protein